MFGFVFNTRKPVFADRKVRKALAMIFDFEWANKNLFFDAYKRTGSFWQGSELSALGVAASEKEKALLAAFPDSVSPEVMDGTERRRNRRLGSRPQGAARCARIAEGSGLHDRTASCPARRTPLAFEIMTKSESEERLAIAYKRTLDILGIEVAIRSVDDAQYQRRIQNFDYDMIVATYASSLSPGVEQELRWGSPSREFRAASTMQALPIRRSTP